MKTYSCLAIFERPLLPGQVENTRRVAFSVHARHFSDALETAKDEAYSCAGSSQENIVSLEVTESK